MAATRGRIKRVLLPARNRKDYEDIPEEVRKGVAFTRLENVDEAIRAALLPKTSPAPAKMRPRAASGT